MTSKDKNQLKNKVKVLVVFTQNRSWGRMIKALFPATKIDTQIFYVKANALAYIRSNETDCVLTDDSYQSVEIMGFVNSIQLVNNKLKFYIYTSDLTLIKNLKDKYTININTFLAPLNTGEVQRQIISDLFPRKKKQVMYNVDLNLLKTFITSANEVMEEMAGIQEMTNFSPFILGDSSKKVETIKVRGSLAINSKHFKGTFYISFPEDTFLKIYENMLGEKETTITEEIRDMGAEFANIIYGKAKRVLNNEGYDLGMVIPGVDSDEKILSTFDIIVIPMFTELGNFYIKVAPNYLKT